MTIIRVNGGKPTTTARALKRDRRRERKCSKTRGRRLQEVQCQLFYYHAKQSRRWLQAFLLGDNRHLITKEAALQLGKHLEKTEYQLQHPRISDTVLLPDAKLLLSQLEMEREAAKAGQGNPERVRDWWAGPTMVGKKKRKRMLKGEEPGATATQNVSAEGLGDEEGALGWEEEEMDVEEGGVL